MLEMRKNTHPEDFVSILEWALLRQIRYYYLKQKERKQKIVTHLSPHISLNNLIKYIESAQLRS
jgi:hypothetical protein